MSKKKTKVGKSQEKFKVYEKKVRKFDKNKLLI